MNDTEPMPVVTPASSKPAAAESSKAFDRTATIAIAIATIAISFALFFVSWAHYELSSLRIEVRDARLAAAAATRAADRAELAARSAQSALASNESADPQTADQRENPGPDSGDPAAAGSQPDDRSP